MRKLLWGLPLGVYLLFSVWYTNTGGALDEQEIAHYFQLMQEQGRDQASLDQLRAFMQADTGRQFLMLNNIDMNENPGQVSGAEPGETSAELMGRYMEHMFPALFQRACHPAYMGNAVFAAMDVSGIEGAREWDSAVLMRYRSRRDLLEIASNPAFAGKHHFKLAALTKTVAYPLENTLYLSDPRLLLGLFLLALVALLDLALFRSGRKR